MYPFTNLAPVLYIDFPIFFAIFITLEPKFFILPVNFCHTDFTLFATFLQPLHIAVPSFLIPFPILFTTRQNRTRRIRRCIS